MVFYCLCGSRATYCLCVRLLFFLYGLCFSVLGVFERLQRHASLRALASFASVFCLATTSPGTIEQVLASLNVLPGNETSCTTKEPLCE